LLLLKVLPRRVCNLFAHRVCAPPPPWVRRALQCACRARCLACAYVLDREVLPFRASPPARPADKGRPVGRPNRLAVRVAA
jgi:hypothetical protein